MSAPAEPAEARPGPRQGVLLFAVLALTFTAYSPVIGAPFAWDDHLLVAEEPRVHQLRPAEYFTGSFWRAGAARSEASYFRPLVTTSFALDWQLSRGKPWLFHLTNLAAHLAACALLFRLARRAGASPALAASASALFGLFPRLTESVAWVSGRTDVLATAAVLAAICLHRREVERGRARWAAAAALLGGLLCKEVALAGAVAIAAGEWAAAARARSGARRALANLAPAAAAVGTWLLLRSLALRGAPGILAAPQPPGLNRPLTALQATGQYAIMLLDPLRPRLQIGTLGEQAPLLVISGAIAAAGILSLLVAAGRRPPAPAVAAGVALALGGLLLVVHAIPINLPTLAADRFLYLPVAGLALAGAAAVGAARPRRPAFALPAVLALGAALAVATYLRCLDWCDEVRLWRAAAATAPASNTLPHIELGNALRFSGHVEEAVEQYRRVLRQGPGRFRRELLANLGSALSDLGEIDEARRALLEALSSGREFAIDRYNLAVLEARSLRFDAAEAELRRALALVPGYPDALQALDFVASARAFHLKLPPERPDEPTALRALRAAFFGQLGAQREACRLWAEVVRAPDADADAVRRGALYLASHGGRVDAEAALDRVRRSAAAGDLVFVLQTEIADRFATAPPR